MVTLFEGRPASVGRRCSRSLPHRAEFGGIATSLTRECELASVSFRRNTPVDAAVLRDFAPDAVILATGATPYVPARPMMKCR